MLILSWNVAGLSTTVKRIHDHVAAAPKEEDNREGEVLDGAASSSQTRKKVKRAHSGSRNTCTALSAFFERHHADIVCLQEHKIPKSQLVNRNEPMQLSHVPGYESFWSCCVDENSRGMNGVCTYARIGSVLKADACPLTLLLDGNDNDDQNNDDSCHSLNRQGRCVKTDHGEFVLFNVYVPASGGQPLKVKLKFLNALRCAMRRTRQHEHKPVILVGDLNITHQPLDVYWSDRVVYVHDVIEEVRQHREEHADAAPLEPEPPTAPPQWKVDVATHWGRIARALETLRAVQTTTRNTKTNQEFTKYRAVVTINDDESSTAANDVGDMAGPPSSSSSRQVFLGKHESDETWCLMGYQVIEPDVHYMGDNDDTSSTEPGGGVVVTRPAHVVSVGVLTELMNKIGGVIWTESVQRDIADHHAGVVKESLPRKWLNAIIEEDGMVDAFRHFYPEAQGRYTCWHQFTNRRYYNEGMRIDYTLVDRSLFDRIQIGHDQGLRCCGGANGDDAEHYHLTEDAALAAATAKGLFQPVSFEGGGIQDATMDALDTQFGTPHTGMIYTPPSFSDHIGISVVLDDNLLRTDLALDSKDSATKKSQPHKLQTSIASFFGNAANKQPGSTAAPKAGSDTAPANKAAEPSKFHPHLQHQRVSSLGSNGSSTKRSAPAAAPVVKATSASSTSSVRQPAKATKPPPPHKNSILNHFRRSEGSK